MLGCEEWRSKNNLVQRARDKIRKDDEMADRIAELDSIRGVKQKAEFECASHAGSTKALRMRALTIQKETVLAKTALILVRKASLLALLEQEKVQYVAELNQQDKALYTQRV